MSRIKEIENNLKTKSYRDPSLHVDDDITFLLEQLKKCREALIFYGNQHLYDREKYLVLNKDLAKDDLEETGYSRFTPGKLARQTLNELEQE